MPKKKHKAKKITLAGGQAVEQRQDRPGRPPGRIAEPADKTALEARMKMMGTKDKAQARSHLAGDPVGLCIWHHTPKLDVQDRLWAVWQAVCSTRRTFRTRILGTTGQPQGAAIAMIPEAMQTDQSHSVDVRTADERDIAAKRGDAYWRAMIGKLPVPQMAMALTLAMDAVEGAVWWDAAPTQRGRNAVAALVWLADASEK